MKPIINIVLLLQIFTYWFMGMKKNLMVNLIEQSND